MATDLQIRQLHNWKQAQVISENKISVPNEKKFKKPLLAIS